MNKTSKDSDTGWDIQHSTQAISLFVGGLFIFLGVWGMFFSGVIGMTFRLFYGLLLTAAGGVLVYFGYKNRSYASFIACTVFAVVFAILSVIGLMNLNGYQQTNFHFLANYKQQGSVDYLLNAILSVVLVGGAIDWYRRYKGKTGIAKKVTQSPPRSKLIHH